jgi:hypothetical protein
MFSRKIAEAEAQIVELQVRVKVLREMEQEFGHRKDHVGPARLPPVEFFGGGEIFNKLGPKAAVFDLLGRRPNLTGREVIRLLHEHVDTAADDPRRTIASTIYNMLRRNELKKDKHDRLSVVAGMEVLDD